MLEDVLQQLPTLPSTEPARAACLGALRGGFALKELFDESPAPNPIPMLPQHVRAVASQPYLVAEKTDGVRGVLVLTTVQYPGAEDCAVAALVDRALTVRAVPISAPRCMFTRGTVLDGELVKAGDGSVRWVLFDAVMVAGAPVGTTAPLPYTHRLQLLRCLVSGSAGLAPLTWTPPCFSGAAPRVAVVVKDVVPLHQWPALVNNGGGVPSDGFVLTPDRPRVAVGKARAVFKVKDTGRDTVDVRVVAHEVQGRPPAPREWHILYKNGPDEVPAAYGLQTVDGVVRLQLDTGGGVVKALRASWDGWSRDPPAAWGDGAAPTEALPVPSARHALLECTFQWDAARVVARLTPVRLRTDKPHPNNTAVLVDTLCGRGIALTTPQALQSLRECGAVPEH